MATDITVSIDDGVARRARDVDAAIARRKIALHRLHEISLWDALILKCACPAFPERGPKHPSGAAP